MAEPTVTNVYPAVGHVGGETMVRILGGNFRTPPDPATLTLADPAPGPTVRVSFGGTEAEYVAVINHALLWVKTPKSPLSASKTGDGSGAVDVLVENLDDDGEPISGEAYTFADGFEYQYTKFTVPGTLSRVVAAIITELRRQIIPNVVYAPHTDYDDDTSDELNTTKLASLPSLALTGPTIRRSTTHTTNEHEYVEGEYGTAIYRKEPYKSDITFTVIGVSDHTGIGLSLQEETVAFLDRLAFLRVAKNPDDLSLGYNLYEVSVPTTDGPVNLNAGSDEANLRTFSASFVIKGFPLYGLGSFGDEAVGALGVTAPVTEIELITEAI